MTDLWIWSIGAYWQGKTEVRGDRLPMHRILTMLHCGMVRRVVCQIGTNGWEERASFVFRLDSECGSSRIFPNLRTYSPHCLLDVTSQKTVILIVTALKPSIFTDVTVFFLQIQNKCLLVCSSCHWHSGVYTVRMRWIFHAWCVDKRNILYYWNSLDCPEEKAWDGRTDGRIPPWRSVFIHTLWIKGHEIRDLKLPNLPVSQSFTVFTGLQGVECRVHCSLLVGVDSWK
jgi:hypothetical protein